MRTHELWENFIFLAKSLKTCYVKIRKCLKNIELHPMSLNIFLAQDFFILSLYLYKSRGWLPMKAINRKLEV